MYKEQLAFQYLIVNTVEGTNAADITPTTIEDYLESLIKKQHVEDSDYGEVVHSLNVFGHLQNICN